MPQNMPNVATPSLPLPDNAAHILAAHMDATRPWEHSVLWFLAHFHLPPGISFGGISFGLCGKGTGRPPTTPFMSMADGSWCEIDERSLGGVHRVWEAGPHQLWRIIEYAHVTWLKMGQPGWERFGLTVRPAQQWVWLDSPDSDIRWTLNLNHREAAGQRGTVSRREAPDVLLHNARRLPGRASPL